MTVACIRSLVPDEQTKIQQVLPIYVVVRDLTHGPHGGPADHAIDRVTANAGAKLEDGDEHGELAQRQTPV